MRINMSRSDYEHNGHTSEWAPAATIGPRGGRTAYIGMRDGERVLTRDGLVISQHLTSRDHHSREGIELLSKTAEEIRRQVGDGAKTALLLCYKVVHGGYEAIETIFPKTELLYHLLVMQNPIAGRLAGECHKNHVTY